MGNTKKCTTIRPNQSLLHFLRAGSSKHGRIDPNIIGVKKSLISLGGGGGIHNVSVLTSLLVKSYSVMTMAVLNREICFIVAGL